MPKQNKKIRNYPRNSGWGIFCVFPIIPHTAGLAHRVERFDCLEGTSFGLADDNIAIERAISAGVPCDTMGWVATDWMLHHYRQGKDPL